MNLPLNTPFGEILILLMIAALILIGLREGKDDGSK